MKWGALVSLALLGATLSAVLRAPTDDGFPLSTYPMFAARRSTKLDLDYAIGVRSNGTTEVLPSEVTGTGEVLQAAAIYEDAIHQGKKAMQQLCASIALQVASEFKTVKIVHGTHDAVRLLVDGTKGDEHTRWTCSPP